MSVRLQPMISRNQPHSPMAVGGCHAKWVRTLRAPGRITGWSGPVTLNFLRRPRPRNSTTLLESHAVSQHFHARIHLAWHTHGVESHFYPSQPTIFRVGVQRENVAPPHATVLRETQQPAVAQTTLTTLRLASKAVFEKHVVSRIERLRARSRFLAERLERNVMSTTQTVVRRSEVERILRTAVERSRRTEDNVPRSQAQVARRQRPHTATLANPEMRPADRAPVEHRKAEETVHTAPWMRQTALAVNLEQITEQVIRQIDSRMIAWRERMGKV
jgi:hypothetical protein